MRPFFMKEYEPFERAGAFLLSGALRRFLFGGNTRTSRFLMKGVLMSNGIDAGGVPAGRAQDINEKMVRSCPSKEGSGMMAFLLACCAVGSQPARA